ncbi:sigma-70 family RNA polymerase sigma factor [Pedobacter frigiditerrae]|uniref:Sigma-70 family RNA polymerase sigma factor n=1 Tax=Pedobacter frigiditerrae TaxID=2530452 RepID=A0A4R0MTH3_9SPHI|nr:sigma-70 family RNA polymerase sigma factor [Pedobacter frigiditerrae]TCC90358.1 sigma-70 family RNA polymerase sigma factor [Pedobacter frigiditerrae]
MQLFPIDLIEGCKKGICSAQRSLFDFYYDYMFNVCLRYLKDEMLTEDILSQGFTKVFNGIGKFKLEKENGLRAWIKTIMINECLIFLRKKNNFFLVPLSEAENIPSPTIDFEELDSSYVLQSISELPIGYRTVLNLNVIEGYSHQEISVMLNIKEATSRSQLAKAKEVLKKKLLEYKLNYYGKG